MTMTVLETTGPEQPARPPVGAPALQRGIMVCDPGGRILAANSQLKEIASPPGSDWDSATTCCNVVCSATPNYPLEGACLTERSLAAGHPLVDVRLEPANSPTALSVTATPLCDAGSGVMFEVRPDDGRSHATPALWISALGPFRVEGPDGSLTGDWLAQRPGELLRFLVCERHRLVPADVIGEAIWPHAGTAAPNTVRHFVHELRHRLDPRRSERPSDSTVVCSRGAYGLDGARVWLDVDEFERHAAAGAMALRCGQRSAAREHLQHAVALYRGDFLAEDRYAEWALCERERLRYVACDALRGLVEVTPGPDAVTHLERLAELEPFDDDVHRELISAWLALGRRSRAVRHYDSFRARLFRTLGAPPGFDLAELAQEREPRVPEQVRTSPGLTPA